MYIVTKVRMKHLTRERIMQLTDSAAAKLKHDFVDVYGIDNVLATLVRIEQQLEDEEADRTESENEDINIKQGGRK